MKATLTRSDGTTIHLEGDSNEVAQAILQLSPAPFAFPHGIINITGYTLPYVAPPTYYPDYPVTLLTTTITPLCGIECSKESCREPCVFDAGHSGYCSCRVT